MPDSLRRMTDTAEHERPRFRARDTDRFWQKVLALVLRAPNVARALSMFGVGALVMGLVFRFFVIDKIEAQGRDHSGRMAKIEAEQLIERAARDTTLRRIKAIETSSAMLIKAQCLRTSKAWQENLQMECSPNLYLGAPLVSK